MTFIGILENVFVKESLQMDKTVYEYVVLNLLSIICIKDKKTGLWIALNLIISAGLNILLKNLIQRPRPEGYRLIQENGYSFPSGHSMVSMAFYGLIVYLIWKKVKNPKERYILCTICAILPILIGFSRIYLGVHYFSDILAGVLISGFVFGLIYKFYFSVNFK